MMDAASFVFGLVCAFVGMSVGGALVHVLAVALTVRRVRASVPGERKAAL